MFSRRSIKMKLYSLTKRQFVLVFVGFFTCIGACAIIGLAGKIRRDERLKCLFYSVVFPV